MIQEAFNGGPDNPPEGLGHLGSLQIFVTALFRIQVIQNQFIAQQKAAFVTQ